jgi:hypothetical protein
MRNLRCQAVILEGRHEADDGLRGTSSDGGDVGVAGGRVVGRRVYATSPADDLAAIDGTLKGNSGNAECFEVPCPHDPVSLHVPQKSVDVAGGGHDGSLMGVTNHMPKYVLAEES